MSTRRAAPSPDVARSTGILVPGRNCWRVARAERVALLVDGAAYYRALRAALERARRSVILLGWDFDSHVVLDPTGPARDERVRDLLLRIARERPELEIRILIWGMSVVYGPSRDMPAILGADWHDGAPNVRLEYDNGLQITASHHHKLVAIDDRIAFVGGIDVTRARWDVPGHPRELAERRDPDGRPYEPTHDVEMLVDGAAARLAADYARRRWTWRTGESLAPVEVDSDPWPEEVAPDLGDVPVGLARTACVQADERAIAEVAALNEDALRAARRWVYVESQYLTAERVGDALAELLRRADPPEIVVLVCRNTFGWLERFAMGSNRDRLIRRLKKLDHRDRLRVVYPTAPDAPEEGIELHSKLIAVDGRFLRIGSSNLANRSLGLDTECDLALEAERPEHVAAITGFRDRLLAEHLGVPPREFAALAAEVGMIGAIERLDRGRLRPFDVGSLDGPDEPIAGTKLIDPDEPVDLEFLFGLLRLRR